MIKILIADDEKLVLDGLEKIISNYSENIPCGLAEEAQRGNRNRQKGEILHMNHRLRMPIRTV